MATNHKSESFKMAKRKQKIENMKSLPFGCKVPIPGYKCVYRSWYRQEMRNHVKNHLRSLKSGMRNRSRYWEEKIESDGFDVIKKLKVKFFRKKRERLRTIVSANRTKVNQLTITLMQTVNY